MYSKKVFNHKAKTICLVLIILFIFLLTSTSNSSDDLNQEFNENVIIEKIRKDYQAEEAIYNKLESIYLMDIINYYGLEEDYNSELKIKLFKNTQEYKNKLNELKLLKNKMMNSYYYSFIESPFLGDYNVKRKGFEFILRYILFHSKPELRKIFVEDNLSFQFPSLTSEIQTTLGVNREILFFPMNEEKGLAIENNKGNIGIYLIYKIIGLGKYTIYSPKYSEREVLKADPVTIIIGNIKSGDIYFQKLYQLKNELF